MKKILFIIITLGIIIIAGFYLVSGNNSETIGNSTNKTQKTASSCEELAKYAKQNAQDIILRECKKYNNKTCTTNQDCGGFPCDKSKCLIKPCDSDSDCPTLCGLHTTPHPGFCTTMDVK